MPLERVSNRADICVRGCGEFGEAEGFANIVVDPVQELTYELANLDDLNTKVYYALSRWPHYEREITADYEISKAAICERNPA